MKMAHHICFPPSRNRGTPHQTIATSNSNTASKRRIINIPRSRRVTADRHHTWVQSHLAAAPYPRPIVVLSTTMLRLLRSAIINLFSHQSKACHQTRDPSLLTKAHDHSASGPVSCALPIDLPSPSTVNAVERLRHLAATPSHLRSPSLTRFKSLD
jgi:hypothetical protein